MSENKITESVEHHAMDEAELDRLQTTFGQLGEVGTDSDVPKENPLVAWLITGAIVALIAIVGIAWIVSRNSASGEKAATEEHKEEGGHSENKTGKEVKLDPELLESAGILTETVTQRPAIAMLNVTGAVELNPETTEMATLLVGGRIERVNYGVGDYVQRGAVLAVVTSPQLAQMHGKMHEAKTKFELAERNLVRVQKTENRVALLQAKARLDEADATLKRTKKLIELGAGAGKDIVTAETNYKTAKAEFDFQSNIALNKELQEAKAEVETAHVDLRHIEDELRALGVPIESNKPDDHRGDTSLVSLRAPLSGVVTERKFNAGAGVEAATPIFLISNLGTVYVIANVPEANMSKLFVGSNAEITSPAIGTGNGRVSYIDPQLDETTRTGRVRIEVPNRNGKLRAGMFADVGFYTGTNAATGQELVVSSDAVQRTGDKTVVFVPREDEPGAFEVREIEVGADINGYTKVLEGLKLGEKVVTKGSFTLKTQLEKGAMGEDH